MKDRTLAKATIQTVIKQLCMCKFFNHARKRKLGSDNPASGLSQLYSQASGKHEVKEPLTQQEVPLLNAIRERKESPQVVPTKTKRIRSVDLSDELISVLKEHVRQQRGHWFAKENKQADTNGKKQAKKPLEWLFPN